MPLRSFKDSINRALVYSMKKDKNMLCFGLGTTDPKGVFGTTLGLEKKFGKKRVFDMPTSENAMTGVSIGASLNGIRSVVTHQRLDFFLLAMDQLINSAAKYHYMYGSQLSVPITIRLIIGRGWGQGPTHSQNLQALFNHIPGLKIVAPTFPNDAKSMLISSIFDPNPVLFLEHRWLFDLKEKRKSGIKKIGRSNIILKGKDITVVSFSYLTIETIKASKILNKFYNINLEIVDLVSLKPIDYKTIFQSIKKTRNVIVLDTGFSSGSIANDIIYNIIHSKYKLNSKPIKLAMPNVPEPTSYGLTKNFYVDEIKISNQVLSSLKIKKRKHSIKNFSKKKYHDIPGDWFKGPF